MDRSVLLHFLLHQALCRSVAAHQGASGLIGAARATAGVRAISGTAVPAQQVLPRRERWALRLGKAGCSSPEGLRSLAVQVCLTFCTSQDRPA